MEHLNGHVLTLESLKDLTRRLCRMSVAERERLKKMAYGRRTEYRLRATEPERALMICSAQLGVDKIHVEGAELRFQADEQAAAAERHASIAGFSPPNAGWSRAQPDSSSIAASWLPAAARSTPEA